ncbi:hydroxymethylbilane synthase [Planctomycetaceae bacterium]|jgi:hydroxymethylbilane synthase|nr:hydroxymethylbilane synthase [Planctomycetaceae bacterium]MDC0308004.1 hydroxymethylbilane synthase [Planctomycetaceae bacterium]MDG2389038.1 hydroxymethylbilane synthase [Planctomycetaceae bacterium]
MNVVPLRIATRASRLALWQANHVAALLREALPEMEVELVEISTQGDRDRTEPLRQFGGLGVFTSEVQAALLDGRADIAVHSLKDLPTAAHEKLSLAAVPQRESVYDALVFGENCEFQTLEDLPEGAKVGTGSPRRQAQLLHVRPDLELAEIRGNVETRLRKVDEGEYDAIVLAEAGLKRLELENRISLRLSPPQMFPAVSQGALGLECRADDERSLTALGFLNDPTSHLCVLAERALLSTLRAGCHAPLGAFSAVKRDELSLSGVVLSLDGSQRIDAEITGELSMGSTLGERLAELLKEQGAAALLSHES